MLCDPIINDRMCARKKLKNSLNMLGSNFGGIHNNKKKKKDTITEMIQSS